MESASLKQSQTERENLESEVKSLQAHITSLGDDLVQLKAKVYEATLREAHIQEIYRLAGIHLPRLFQVPSLREADIQELEKWIARAKDSQSLAAIVGAIKEVSKYQPSEIKSNLYGLIQKIIIEGPFNNKKR